VTGFDAKSDTQPLPNKLATAAWFLRRPQTYPHLVELVRRSLSRSTRRELESSGREAVAWAQPLARSPQDALQHLLGPGSYPPPRELHPAVFAEAQARVDEGGMVLGGAANLELVYHVTRSLAARRVIETGVAYGWSSLAILLAQETIGGGTLTSTDMPYPRMGNERLVGCVVPDRLRKSWTLVRRPDRPALPRALANLGRIDLAHYDSDKTYAGQSWAFSQMWAALRPGGVLIADDIDCQTAFRDFAARIGEPPSVVDGGGKLIGVLRKADPA
jgi:predicted O-methyltransferase YrrM